MYIGESLIMFEYGTWGGGQIAVCLFYKGKRVTSRIECQFIRPSETTVSVALRASRVTE